MKQMMKRFLSGAVCLCMFVGMGLSAGADSSPSSKMNLIGSNGSSSSSVSTEKSIKDRLDECITVYNDYQKVKKERKAKTPDSFTTVYSISGIIKQIDVLADYAVKKDASNSKYVVYDDFSAIYYYTDDGLPRFALFTDKSSVYKKEYRFYLSEGEVIKWVDNDGEEYYGDPQNLPGLYEIALANYSRAMYDCYNKGKYSIQVGCFTDEKDAKACQKSMADLGEDVIVKEIDNAYCVLTRYYFDDWDSASSYGAEMSFSDDCGVIFVRLL